MVITMSREPAPRWARVFIAVAFVFAALSTAWWSLVGVPGKDWTRPVFGIGWAVLAVGLGWATWRLGRDQELSK